MNDGKSDAEFELQLEKEQLEKLQRTPKFFAKRLSSHKSAYNIAKSLYGTYIDFIGVFHILPNFLVIGAARAGSTSLYEGLKNHPSFFSSKIKEIYFFDVNFHRGLNWYKRFFPSKWKKFVTTELYKKDFITGEATPHYINNPHVPKRVFDLIPNVKLIVLLRNPIDRAYSQYQSRVSAGTESLSFEDAIKKEDNRLEKEIERMEKDKNYFNNNVYRFSYLHHGMYIIGLKRWMEKFPKKQFLIIKAEEFFKNPQEIFASVHEFLGLPKFIATYYTHFNLGKYQKMNTTTRKFLKEYFKPYNEELYSFLGRNFEWEMDN